MKRLIELRETRAAKMSAMAEAMAAEGDEARARFDALDAEVRAIDADILRHERLADIERRANADPVGARFAEEMRGYSVAKAIQEASTGRLTGREAEAHAELSRGREVRGVMVPTDVLLETRNQVTNNAPAGGYLVATTVAALEDRPRPKLIVEALGAMVMRGLTGNVDLPNTASSGSASWVDENGAPTRSAVAFQMTGMTPRTIAGEYRVSRRLMLQSSQSIESILRSDLGQILAAGLDKAAIQGIGASNQPRGLLNTPNVTKTTTAAGDFITTASDMIADLETDDVTGEIAFATSPKVGNAIRKIKDSQGHVIPVAEQFHGRPLMVSSQVPDNIGTGSNKSALICGVWSSLVIGYWSAVDILVNPYHSDVASSGGALIHAFLDADVAVRQPKAFAYAEI